MEYQLAVIVPLVIFFILDAVILGNTLQNGFKTMKEKIFAAFAITINITQISTIFAYACDLGAMSVNEGLQFTFDFLSILGMTTSSYLWFEYLLEMSELKRYRTRYFRFIRMIPVMVFIVTSIASPWTHWVFYISDGQYHVGTMFFLQIVCGYFYTFMALCISIISAIKKGNSVKLARNFVLYAIPAMTGSFLNIKVARGGYAQIGCSIAFILVFLEQYIDDINESKRLKSLEEINVKLQNVNEDLEKRIAIINTTSKSFSSIYYIDMADYTFTELGVQIDRVKEVIGENGDAISSFKRMCKYLVSDDKRKELLEFTDVTTLNERMKDKDWISIQFDNKDGVWLEGIFIGGNKNDSGEFTDFIWVTRNIDEAKKKEIEYQEALEGAMTRAESANVAKTMFLNNMSHDIRTPMNAIIGYSVLMEKELKNPEKMKEYVSKIKSSGDYLLTLINNVLEVARIDSGVESVDAEFTDLMDDSCSVAPLLDSELKKKNITFTCNMNIKNRYVFADMKKIKEINMNLISNAIKYTPEGGRIHMEFEELETDREGYSTYVNTISDNGIGMSPDFQKKIFDLFSRERNTTDSKIGGTGLGMSIVKKLVDMMDGEIELVSNLGRGTAIKVTLCHRLVENPEPYLEAKIKEDIIDYTSFSGKKVLLAEDNELNAEIAKALLEEQGIEVEHAEDGVECIKKYTDFGPGYFDLILMDILMPNLSGLDAARRIRELEMKSNTRIPIIALTANAFEEDKKKAIDAGMDGHLSKPIDISKMMKSLSEVFSNNMGK